MMLKKLLLTSREETFSHVVFSLNPRMDNEVINELEKNHIDIHYFDLGSILHAPISLFQMIVLARRYNPGILQGWMYHGNFIASFIARFLPRKSLVVWNVRHSLSDLANEKKMTLFLIRANCLYGTNAVSIIYNSNICAFQHEKAGFKTKLRKVIPNGFDTCRFKPDSHAREKIRSDLGFSNNHFVIGMVARFHPTKGYGTFLLAAAKVVNEYPNTRFVLIGYGIGWNNPFLSKEIERLRLGKYVRLMGECTNIPQLMNSFDLFTLTSLGEAFPNVIGEAMSCGIPCVATDVGDIRKILGHTGFVVPPGESVDLARAWEKFLLMESNMFRAIGTMARQEIENNYSIQKISQKYEAHYFELLKTFNV